MSYRGYQFWQYHPVGGSCGRNRNWGKSKKQLCKTSGAGGTHEQGVRRGEAPKFSLKERRRGTMTFGSIVLLAVIVGMVVIGGKVKENSRKLQELEKTVSK